MKVIVHPLLPTGNFLNCRIGVEMDYPDDFSLEQAINIEWDKLLAIHMKRYPHLYNEKGEPLYEKAPMDDECRGTKVVDILDDAPIDKRIAGIIEDIDSLTVIDAKNGFGVQVGLLSYEELAETDHQIKEAYLKKYDELTNKTK